MFCPPLPPHVGLTRASNCPAVKLLREKATGKDRGMPPNPERYPRAEARVEVVEVVEVVEEEARREERGMRRGINPKDRRRLSLCAVNRVEKEGMPELQALIRGSSTKIKELFWALGDTV